MALPATEAFTDTNGVGLAVHNASWVHNSSGDDFVINTNAVATTNAADPNISHWEGDTFSNDQYAQGTLAAHNSSSVLIGVAVRCAASTTDTAYYYVGRPAFGANDNFLVKLIAGVETVLVADNDVIDVNDVMYLSAVGTTLTGKKNTVTLATTTDSSITSGYAGFATKNSSTTAIRLDTWEGGNVSAGGTAGRLVNGCLVNGLLMGSLA